MATYASRRSSVLSPLRTAAITEFQNFVLPMTSTASILSPFTLVNRVLPHFRELMERFEERQSLLSGREPGCFDVLPELRITLQADFLDQALPAAFAWKESMCYQAEIPELVGPGFLTNFQIANATAMRSREFGSVWMRSHSGSSPVSSRTIRSTIMRRTTVIVSGITKKCGRSQTLCLALELGVVHLAPH